MKFPVRIFQIGRRPFGIYSNEIRGICLAEIELDW